MLPELREEILSQFGDSARYKAQKIRIALGRNSPEVGRSVVALSNSGLFPNLKMWVPELDQFKDHSLRTDLFTKKKHYGIDPVGLKEQQAFVDDLKGAHVIFSHSISGPKLPARKTQLEHFLSSVRHHTDDDVSFTVILSKGYGDREDRDQVVEVDGIEYPKFNSLACRDFARSLKLFGGDRLRLIMLEPHSFDAIQIFEEVLGEENVIFPTLSPFFGRDELNGSYPMSPDGGKGIDRPMAEASLVRAAIAKFARDGEKITNAGVEAYLREEAPLIDKVRIEDGVVKSQLIRGADFIKGKDLVLMDDISGSGKTAEEAAINLLSQGARSVRLIVSHGEFQYIKEEERKKFDGQSNALAYLLTREFNGQPLLTDITVGGTIPRLEKRFKQPSYLPQELRDRVHIAAIGDRVIVPWMVNACDLQAGLLPTFKDEVILKPPLNTHTGRSQGVIRKARSLGRG